MLVNYLGHLVEIKEQPANPRPAAEAPRAALAGKVAGRGPAQPKDTPSPPGLCRLLARITRRGR
jgi:hypothetical protein